MNTYNCNKCNKEFEVIGIPPQIQLLQGYKNVMNIGGQVPQEIKDDPFLYRGFYCTTCNKAFCPSCCNNQGQICPICGQTSLMPAYRPLINKVNKEQTKSSLKSLKMFQKPFSFEGRIRRTEYGLSIIIYLVIAIIINAIGATGEGAAVIFLAYIPMYWFLFAQGAKRCHDRGNSGWYQIIPFYVFWLLFADSDIGTNKHGDNPKGLENQELTTIKEIENPDLNLKKKSDIDIFKAVSNKDTTALTSYIKSGGDIEIKDQWKLTPLIWGCHYGYTDIVKALIEAKANVNSKDINDQTALMKASDKGHTNIVKILINANADVDAKDIRGQSALIMASQNGHADIVKLMIEAKANINTKDNEGLTALMWATFSEHANVIEVLNTAEDKKSKKKSSQMLSDETDIKLPVITDEKEYARRCLEIEFKEELETRKWNSDPAFGTVLTPYNSQQFDIAIENGKKLIPKFNDFDLLHKWVGDAYLYLSQFEKAREILFEGVVKSKRKCLLLTSLAEVEWKTNSLENAIYFLSQALHCLYLNKIDYNAYLLLHYIAKGLGLVLKHNYFYNM